MTSVPDDKKEEYAQTYAEVHVSKSSIVLEMTYRDVIKLRAECDKSKLDTLCEELYWTSIMSEILDNFGITNKLVFGVGSRKKSNRLVIPLLCLPVDTPSSKLNLVEEKASELFDDPAFQSSAKEITESSLAFFRDNLTQELHCALDNLILECQLLAMQAAASKRGDSDSLPRKVVKRVKDLRFDLSKERFSLRRGRRRNSPTRSREALIRKEQRTADAIKQRRVKLIEAARLLLENQVQGKPGNELTITNLAAKLGKSRQTISKWMEDCGYDPEGLESEAARSIRRQMNK